MLFNPEKFAEQEREAYKLSDLESYRKGLDLVFGIGSASMSPEQITQELVKAEKASVRQYEHKSGERVMLTIELANDIVTRLGRERAMQDLGVYKTEIEEAVHERNPVVSEDMQARRAEARKELFMTENIRRVTFG